MIVALIAVLVVINISLKLLAALIGGIIELLKSGRRCGTAVILEEEPMPVDRALYPGDWPQIQAHIIAKNGNRCSTCGVRNYSVGVRENGQFVCYSEAARTYQEAVEIRKQYDNGIIIVLAVCHKNHNPADCQDSNLFSACQLHHLKHDRYLHSLHARVTWARKRETRHAA